MRTTLDLDKSLMDTLVRESGCASKTEAIETAAREYLRILRMQEMVASFGKIQLDTAAILDMRKKDRQRDTRLSKRWARG